jgi:hypothetical protein
LPGAGGPIDPIPSDSPRPNNASTAVVSAAIVTMEPTLPRTKDERPGISSPDESATIPHRESRRNSTAASTGSIGPEQHLEGANQRSAAETENLPPVYCQVYCRPLLIRKAVLSRSLTEKVPDKHVNQTKPNHQTKLSRLLQAVADKEGGLVQVPAEKVPDKHVTVECTPRFKDALAISGTHHRGIQVPRLLKDGEHVGTEHL